MNIYSILLICGGLVGLILFSSALWIIDDYSKNTIADIPTYSCYKLEFSQDRFKPTSDIYKELVKEFEKRECPQTRGNND